MPKYCKCDATITALEGMVKELADSVDAYGHIDGRTWIANIAVAPADDPVKLHNMILLALSMRMADKLEVEE